MNSVKNQAIVSDKIKVTPKKHLGQNFLQNQTICNKIVNAVNIANKELILEIGPGEMALTKILLSNTNNFIIIEKDKQVIDFLVNYFNNNSYQMYDDIKDDSCNIKIYKAIKVISENKNILLIQMDAMDLKIDLICLLYNKIFNTKFIMLKIVANLPYNIATMLLYKWCENQNYNYISTLTIMIQKEVAQRIVSKIKSKESYGKLSVISQLLFKSNILFDVSADNFFPKPKVTSSVISMIKDKDDIINLENVKQFMEFLTIAFNNKRKILLNVLNTSKYNIKSNEMNSSFIQEISKKRIEEISPQEIYRIFCIFL